MNESDQFTWQLAFFLVGSLLVFGVVASVITWQLMSTYRAKMSVARETAYRDLATVAATSIETVKGELERANEQLADLKARTVEMERILKDVG